MPDVSTQTDKLRRRPFKTTPTIKKAVKKRPPKNQEIEKPKLLIMFDDVE